MCAAAEGDFTPSRAFPALTLVPPPGTQDPGRGPAEKQPRGKIKTHVQPETFPDSVCCGAPLLAGDSAREALDICSRDSLVPFDDSVKSDPCDCT